MLQKTIFIFILYIYHLNACKNVTINFFNSEQQIIKQNQAVLIPTVNMCILTKDKKICFKLYDNKTGINLSMKKNRCIYSASNETAYGVFDLCGNFVDGYFIENDFLFVLKPLQDLNPEGIRLYNHIDNNVSNIELRESQYCYKKFKLRRVPINEKFKKAKTTKKLDKKTRFFNLFVINDNKRFHKYQDDINEHTKRIFKGTKKILEGTNWGDYRLKLQLSGVLNFTKANLDPEFLKEEDNIAKDHKYFNEDDSSNYNHNKIPENLKKETTWNEEMQSGIEVNKIRDRISVKGGYNDILEDKILHQYKTRISEFDKGNGLDEKTYIKEDMGSIKKLEMNKDLKIDEEKNIEHCGEKNRAKNTASIGNYDRKNNERSRLKSNKQGLNNETSKMKMKNQNNNNLVLKMNKSKIFERKQKPQTLAKSVKKDIVYKEKNHIDSEIGPQMNNKEASKFFLTSSPNSELKMKRMKIIEDEKKNSKFKNLIDKAENKLKEVHQFPTQDCLTEKMSPASRAELEMQHNSVYNFDRGDLLKVLKRIQKEYKKRNENTPKKSTKEDLIENNNKQTISSKTQTKKPELKIINPKVQAKKNKQPSNKAKIDSQEVIEKNNLNNLQTSVENNNETKNFILCPSKNQLLNTKISTSEAKAGNESNIQKQKNAQKYKEELLNVHKCEDSFDQGSLTNIIDKHISSSKKETINSESLVNESEILKDFFHPEKSLEDTIMNSFIDTSKMIDENNNKTKVEYLKQQSIAYFTNYADHLGKPLSKSYSGTEDTIKSLRSTLNNKLNKNNYDFIFSPEKVNVETGSNVVKNPNLEINENVGNRMKDSLKFESNESKENNRLKNNQIKENKQNEATLELKNLKNAELQTFSDLIMPIKIKALSGNSFVTKINLFVYFKSAEKDESFIEGLTYKKGATSFTDTFSLISLRYEDSVYYQSKVLAHEILHSLGASHDDQPGNLMEKENCITCRESNFYITQKTIDEVKNTLKEEGYFKPITMDDVKNQIKGDLDLEEIENILNIDEIDRIATIDSHKDLTENKIYDVSNECNRGMPFETLECKSFYEKKNYKYIIDSSYDQSDDLYDSNQDSLFEHKKIKKNNKKVEEKGNDFIQYKGLVSMFSAQMSKFVKRINLNRTKEPYNILEEIIQKYEKVPMYTENSHNSKNNLLDMFFSGNIYQLCDNNGFFLNGFCQTRKLYCERSGMTYDENCPEANSCQLICQNKEKQCSSMGFNTNDNPYPSAIDLPDNMPCLIKDKEGICRMGVCVKKKDKKKYKLIIIILIAISVSLFLIYI